MCIIYDPKSTLHTHTNTEYFPKQNLILGTTLQDNKIIAFLFDLIYLYV